MTAVNHLTRAQREDILTELRELQPALRDATETAMRAHMHHDLDGTAFETDDMRATRAQLADAHRVLADATTAYRASIRKAIDYLEGQ